MMEKTDRFVEFNASVLAAIENTLHGVGEEAEGYAKELLQVPVQYVGGYVIRSAPGDPPRKETGELQAGVQFVVEKQGGDAVQLTLSSDRPSTPDVPLILERGDPASNVAPRPYFTRTKDEALLPACESAVPEALKNLR